jgi:tRNA A37 threonylcarbamoyladenosine synthetase subunit TsaC/SUA5/YrdC
MGNSFSLEDVPDSIVSRIDIVCDAGTCTHANPDRLPSSIVDLETGQLTRRGILHEEIGRLLDG